MARRPVDQVDLRGDFIELSTPLEITVQNWRVLLKFEKGRLTRLQVGTLDNLNIEPHDYPLCASLSVLCAFAATTTVSQRFGPLQNQSAVQGPALFEVDGAGLGIDGGHL